ncbi:hypothetical protein KM427_01865 [Nocardioides sp. LMS-CY]|uniref:hypothetical protein n=1 Tax=Nocardioides sp. (strain LMS-CY) TaxID=2840457 RepID=UPI001C000D44|nr:hypothetical protein [Nocardioides sp. LMS-CY]QWF22519.1 hypothetical protein KM427_01865 [Nocardioides sp. LMS-CY]
MTTLRLRLALATAGDVPQPYVCDDLDATVRLDADVYVGTAVSSPRQREAWWRKMREAGHETYHRHGDAPISTRLPVQHSWTGAVRLDVSVPTQVLGPRCSGRRVERARARGVTSVVAAEVGACAPAYHPEQLVAAHRGSLWVAVVPAPGIDVVVGPELLVPAGELHAGPVLAVDLELTGRLRAGRACATAPDAVRRPPPPVAHADRAAR